MNPSPRSRQLFEEFVVFFLMESLFLIGPSMNWPWHWLTLSLFSILIVSLIVFVLIVARRELNL